MDPKNKVIAIVGCGPSGLFMLKRLLETGKAGFSVLLFESQPSIGFGMPYGPLGANPEHVTNVSANEIPPLKSSLSDWIIENKTTLDKQYDNISQKINEYKVIPRLLMGEYLRAQFNALLGDARGQGITIEAHVSTRVTDLVDLPVESKVQLHCDTTSPIEADYVIICSGHVWPLSKELQLPGYFDSPYPPSKLSKKFNHEIAIIGSSLTAIDAIRTLSRANGSYTRNRDHVLKFVPDQDQSDFKIALYSKHGLLPAIRFHLADPHLSKSATLSKAQIELHRKENGGFVSLDYIFEKDFKEIVRKKDPAFYDGVKELDLESFVTTMLGMREKSEPFQLLHAESIEAQQSIAKHKSVYWKEAIAILSFSMNYPAKYFSAEDSIRLQEVLMPLISVIIAFIPQGSSEELLALHDAGRLSLTACGDETTTEPVPGGGFEYSYFDSSGTKICKNFQTIINCTGQRHLNVSDFPFKSLVENKVVKQAQLQFRDTKEALRQLKRSPDSVTKVKTTYFLNVSGISINDRFQPLSFAGKSNTRISIMAVPFIGGFNPDYSGLDFCEEASSLIADAINEKLFTC